MEIENVRNILLQEWDPLDVGDNANLADEYDAYLPTILNLVNAGHTSHEIVEYLKGVEENMGITLPAERRTKAAFLLAG